MLSWRRVKLVLTRELRDQLRDRRTLFMVVALPLLLYPTLGIGMMQMSVLFAEQRRNVVVLGARHLPETPQLLTGDQFANEWFAVPDEARRLRVIVGDDPAVEPLPADAAICRSARELQAELQHESTLESQLMEIDARLAALKSDAAAASSAPESTVASTATTHSESTTPSEPINTVSPAFETDRLKQERATTGAELASCRARLSQLFAESGLHLLVIVPDGFATNLNAANASLARSQTSDQAAAGNETEPTSPLDYARPRIIFNQADDRSAITYLRVRNILSAWEDAVLSERLRLAGLPASLPHPVKPVAVNVALDEQVAANLWAKLFPAILVMMAMTGAFYPAIDLVAGEKERGTMETLLICPASRAEIVLGKFFTVMIVSAATAILNLASMSLTGQHMIGMAPPGMLAAVELSMPGTTALLWTAAVLVPLSALFSALSLAIATFARSTKEGQYYLTPLLMITLGCTMVCMSPGVELKPQFCVIPVAGPALLLKGLLQSSHHSMEMLRYAVPVLLTSVLYCGLALAWAIDQFQKESVLFRDAERFDLRIWLRHVFREKETIPSPFEALFCFVVIMLLQFTAMSYVGSSLAGLTPADPAWVPRLQQTVLLQQIVVVLCPTLFMAMLLTKSVRTTLRLYWPGWKPLGLAVLLAAAMHPLSIEFAHLTSGLFEPLPEGVQAALKGMCDAQQPLWRVLLVFAIAPAICEELAFRGFILSGFRQQSRGWTAVLGASLLFGIMHLVPQQVLNASLVGLVLGLVVVRTDSILPGILFHAAYNGLAVMHGRSSGAADVAGYVVSVEGGVLRYGWPVLFAAALMSGVLMRWLYIAKPVTESALPTIESSPVARRSTAEIVTAAIEGAG